jgi:hypothetical protein
MLVALASYFPAQRIVPLASPCGLRTKSRQIRLEFAF